MKTLFSSKAQTLLWLQNNTDFNVPYVFPVLAENWRQNPDVVLQQILEEYGEGSLVVRSSCSMEDSEECSGAGAFTSLLNVPASSESLRNAIEKVFDSYGLEDIPNSEEVLVQPMVKNIAASGVIFTRTLADGAPYYVINYDDESGRTDTITGGTGVNKTVYIYRDTQPEGFDSSRLKALYIFAKAVEDVCGHDALDIEFGMDKGGTIHLFQVRPICATQAWDSSTEARIRTNVSHVVSFLESCFLPKPGLYGKKTILGVMPDWNPAEMIGVTPHPLASSLYRNLITKRVWSRAREAIGYRMMPAEELMVLIAGRPYIDARASFNSFLPEGLDPVVGEKLVNAWLDRLDAKPELHDKIEFDVALTVKDFCFEAHMDDRYPDVLTPEERRSFDARLTELTARCLDVSRDGGMALAEQSIRTLFERQQNRELPTTSYLSHVVNYLEECRLLGTFAFSVLARHGFIAESLLRTAVTRGVLTAGRVASLKEAVETVSREISTAFAGVVNGTLLESNFFKKYGHLRPATYDILSPCYAQRPELFNNCEALPTSSEVVPFHFTEEECDSLTRLLAEAGLGATTPDMLLEYIQRAIAGREYGKFVFTRNISDVLELVARWGEQHGFSREELAYLSIDDIVEWNSVSLLCEPKAYFERKIAAGKDLFVLGRNMQLGYIIRSSSDVYIVPQHRSAPNFVGSGCVEAPFVVLDAHSSCDVSLRGVIVCIENADPGFDWIFTRNISGLVTKFGGANSHMAIRCAEYGLPAVIGAGEKLFEECAKASRGILNIDSRTLQQIS